MIFNNQPISDTSSLQNLLHGDHFVTIAEIAASKNQSKDEILSNANNLLSRGIDIVAFSDQALVKAEYFKLSELANLNVFQDLPTGAVMPVMKARTKTKDDIQALIKNLKSQNVKNLFVVTGDSSGDEVDTHNSSLNVLPLARQLFFTGSVAHPQPNDIPKMLTKMKAGAQFFIMQATYDHNEWSEWAKAIKVHEVHKKAPIIAVIMPVVSSKVLSVIQGIKEVRVPASFKREFENLNKDEARAKGIELAKAAITTYKRSGIISGIYIYSKSSKVITELNNFIRTI